MASADPFLSFTRKLSELRIPYVVRGGVAAVYYGEPRLTNDIDIILFLRPEDVSGLAASFHAGQYYCPPMEVIRAELERPERGHFNLIDQRTGFKADIYLSGRDPLHPWALERARKVDLDGDVLVLAPPEYVILRKLQFYREGQSRKHLRDIHRMLVSLGDEWDRAGLEPLIEKYGLASEWAEAQAASDA